MPGRLLQNNERDQPRLSVISRNSSRAIMWSTWIMGSANSKDFANSNPIPRTASSCCCGMRTKQSCMYLLARMDLVQSYRAMEGMEPQLDKLGGTGWATRKARVKKSLAEMADQLLRIYATRKMTGAHAFPPTRRGSMNSKTRLNSRKRATRLPRSLTLSVTWKEQSPWIGCCAATSATERRK